MKQQLKIDISKYHSIKPKPKPVITNYFVVSSIFICIRIKGQFFGTWTSLGECLLFLIFCSFLSHDMIQTAIKKVIKGSK